MNTKPDDRREENRKEEKERKESNAIKSACKLTLRSVLILRISHWFNIGFDLRFKYSFACAHTHIWKVAHWNESIMTCIVNQTIRYDTEYIIILFFFIVNKKGWENWPHQWNAKHAKHVKYGTRPSLQKFRGNKFN